MVRRAPACQCCVRAVSSHQFQHTATPTRPRPRPRGLQLSAALSEVGEGRRALAKQGAENRQLRLALQGAGLPLPWERGGEEPLTPPYEEHSPTLLHLAGGGQGQGQQGQGQGQGRQRSHQPGSMGHALLVHSKQQGQAGGASSSSGNGTGRHSPAGSLHSSSAHSDSDRESLLGEGGAESKPGLSPLLGSRGMGRPMGQPMGKPMSGLALSLQASRPPSVSVASSAPAASAGSGPGSTMAAAAAAGRMGTRSGGQLRNKLVMKLLRPT